METLAAQVHILQTARGLTDSSPQTGPTPGRWRSGEQDPAAAAFRILLQELEAKQTEAAAKAYALEADLFSALAKLSDRSDAQDQNLLAQVEALGQALLAAQEDSVTLNRKIETLASGSGPAAAPAAAQGAADPWWTG